MLAFAAMMLATTYTLTVQQQYVMSMRQGITREMEEIAGTVAVEAMEAVRSRAFDQAEVDGTVTGDLTDLALFEYSNNTDHFATGNACSVFSTGADVCDDVDDFHMMVTATMPFAMGVDTVYFSVDIEVEYVDETFARANERTFNKQVTVFVRDTWPGTGTNPFMPSNVFLSRVFSYEFSAL